MKSIIFFIFISVMFAGCSNISKDGLKKTNKYFETIDGDGDGGGY